MKIPLMVMHVLYWYYDDYVINDYVCYLFDVIVLIALMNMYDDVMMIIAMMDVSLMLPTCISSGSQWTMMWMTRWW